MRLYLISPFAEPEKGANVLRINSLKSFLEKKGIKVVVLAPKRKGISSSYGVLRYPSAFSLFKFILMSKKAPVLYTSPPLTHGFFSGLASFLSGKPFYLDIRDPWPDSYVWAGIYSPKSPKTKFYYFLEFLTFLFSRKIFCATEGIVEIVQKKRFGKKAVLAPNGYSASDSLLSSFSKKIASSKNKKTISFVYSGNIEHIGFGEFINTFSFFPSNYTLTLLSSAPISHPLIQLSKKVLGKRFSFISIKNQPFKKVYSLLSMHDVGVSLIPENMNYRIVAKTYDYCSAGLFCLAKGPKKGSLKSLFTKHKIGKYFSSWKSLHNFRISRKELLPLQRKKRILLAKEFLNRNIANKIIFNTIFKGD